MKEGWESKKMSEVCRLINGRAYKKPELLSEGKYPVLRVGNLFTNNQWYYSDLDLDEDKYCNNGDLIYAWSASFGPRIWEGEKVIYHYHIWKILPDFQLITRDYLFHLFEWDKEQIRSAHGTGTTMIHVGKGSMENRIIPIPPLSEQQQIVAILDRAFAAIDQARANVERNLENARELFQSELNEVFCQTGEGWEEKQMDEVCAITSKLINPEEKKYQNLMHVGGGNIVAETGELVDLKTAKEEGLKSGKFVFDSKMVLYNKIRPYLVKVSRPTFNGLCSADMYPLTPNDEEIIRDFLYFLLISKDFTDYAIKGSARAGMPKVNRKHLFKYSFSLPSVAIQNEIIKELDELTVKSRQLVQKYNLKIQHLEELKKSILQKAFTGELTSKPIPA